MYDIYLITNQINEKIYVGQTKNTIHIRWLQHLCSCSGGDERPLYRAMRKYGVENFTVSCLETGLKTVEQADEAESLWITRLDSLITKNGYNLTTGGYSGRHVEGSRRRAEISIPKEEVARRYDEGSSVCQLAEELGVYYSTIIRWLKETGRKVRTNDNIMRKERLISEGKEALVDPKGEDLVRLYESGLSISDLSKIFEMARRNIRKRLVKENLVLRESASVWVGDLKVCCVCHLPKSLEEMVPSKHKKCGYTSYCKPCWKNYVNDRNRKIRATETESAAALVSRESETPGLSSSPLESCLSLP